MFYFVHMALWHLISRNLKMASAVPVVAGKYVVLFINIYLPLTFHNLTHYMIMFNSIVWTLLKIVSLSLKLELRKSNMLRPSLVGW